MDSHQIPAAGERAAEDSRTSRPLLPKPGFFEVTPGTGSAMATCIEIMRQVKAGRDPIDVCQTMLDELVGTCCQ